MRQATGLTLFFDGMNAAMVGVVGAVTVDLARSALRSRRDVALAGACALLLAFRVVSEPALAVAAASVGAILGSWSARDAGSPPGEHPDAITASVNSTAPMTRQSPRFKLPPNAAT